MKGFSLEGRTALVTGSSRGIGAALARAFAAAGARVAVHCAGRRAEAARIAEEIGSLAVPADPSEADGARRCSCARTPAPTSPARTSLWTAAWARPE